MLGIICPKERNQLMFVKALKKHFGKSLKLKSSRKNNLRTKLKLKDRLSTNCIKQSVRSIVKSHRRSHNRFSLAETSDKDTYFSPIILSLRNFWSCLIRSLKLLKQQGLKNLFCCQRNGNSVEYGVQFAL